MEHSESNGIPSTPIVLLYNLYDNKEATVRMEIGEIDYFGTGKGVRQGCILSPTLFNMYAEGIMQEAGVDKSEKCIGIGGRKICR